MPCSASYFVFRCLPFWRFNNDVDCVLVESRHVFPFCECHLFAPANSPPMFFLRIRHHRADEGTYTVHVVIQRFPAPLSDGCALSQKTRRRSHGRWSRGLSSASRSLFSIRIKIGSAQFVCERKGRLQLVIGGVLQLSEQLATRTVVQGFPR